MSTRATYEFRPSQDNRHIKPVTVYIHCDGYPSGAAAYFYDALCLGHGQLVSQFIRANAGASITGTHDTHGDTEYRYTVTGDGPCAMVKVEHHNYDDEWIHVAFTTLTEFIDRNKELIEDYKPFKLVECSYSTQWHNATTMQAELNDPYSCLNSLRVWTNKDSANYKSAQAQLLRAIIAFPELATDEMKALVGV